MVQSWFVLEIHFMVTFDADELATKLRDKFHKKITRSLSTGKTIKFSRATAGVLSLLCFQLVPTRAARNGCPKLTTLEK